MEFDPVLLSRIQFAFVVSFHIIFPSFTIGLAAWLATIEGVRLATGNTVYRRIFDFWLKVFALSFVCSLVMAFNLAAFLGAKATLGFGVFAGFATGLGWVAMSLAIIYLFEQRSLKLWLVNGGCQVVTYTLMGAILGGWK